MRHDEERHVQGRFGVDPRAARLNASPVKAAVHAMTAVLVLVFCLLPLGQEILAVHPFYLSISTFLFVVDHIDASARIRDHSLFRKDAGLRRFLAFLVPMLYLSSFAAPSSNAAPSTWAFLAMGGVVRGLTGYAVDRSFVAVVFASGLGFHLLTAPQWTPLSLAAATLASIFACLAGVLGERMIRHALDLEARATSADDLAQEARGEARRLAAAMSLHDGLSGLVFGVRTKLEGARDTASIKPSVVGLIQRTRELLAPLGASLDVEHTLRELASLYDVPITIEGQLGADLRRLEARDLAFAAIEMTTNALRHHHPRRVIVRLASSPQRLVEVESLEGDAAPQTQSKAGRGSRHLALRARAWGGVYTQSRKETTSHARVAWTPPAQRRGLGWLAIATPLSASLFFGVLWLGDPDPLAVGFVVVCVLLSAAMVGLGARTLNSTKARIVRSEGEREQSLDETMAMAHSAKLDEALDALARALDTQDRDAVHAQLAAFTTALQSLMATLENASASPPERSPVRFHV